MAGTDNLTPFTKDDPRASEAGKKSSNKGTQHLSTWVQNMLHDEEFTTMLVDPKEGYKLYVGVPVKAIVQTAITKAVAGDDKAREWLAKYGYGTKQTIEHEGSLVVGTPDPDKAKKFAEFLRDDTKDS